MITCILSTCSVTDKPTTSNLFSASDLMVWWNNCLVELCIELINITINIIIIESDWIHCSIPIWSIWLVELSVHDWFVNIDSIDSSILHSNYVILLFHQYISVSQEVNCNIYSIIYLIFSTLSMSFLVTLMSTSPNISFLL